ncbi:polymorphic toxin-type HINT domain-containing protein [Streptomyces sp. NBC_01358]|uniref:polymorphic toxin-type HINT domain-containing protein n=1 Tax=Streptomyces sp. NBC_01358 TaxID=2903837 RepID=UPI003FCD9242
MRRTHVLGHTSVLRRWSWRKASRRRITAIALPVSAAVVATLLGAAPAENHQRDHSSTQKATFGKAEPFAAKTKKIKDPTIEAAAKTRSRSAHAPKWPEAADVTVDVPKSSHEHVKAAGLPLTVSQPQHPNGTAQRLSADALEPAPDQAQVRFLGREAAGKLGIDGLVLTIARADGNDAAASVGATIDYSGFANAYSGNWSSRLRMVQLPACSLTTPEKAACRTTTPVPSSNNSEEQTLTAQVTTSEASSAAAPAVFALSAGASSDQGTYAATPLEASSTWAAGGSNGDFTWNYPLDTPPTPAGPAPSLSIGYSAQSVDGHTSSTSAQPSWVGDGFDIPVSYIERAYGSCEDDGQDKKYDQCWKEDNASLVLNGKSTPLVKDETSKEWHPKSDDGERVVHDTGASNGDDDGEFWTVTSTDGTQYVFGKNKLQGWSDHGTAADDPVTNSAWTVPVYGDDTGEPGYSSGSSFADRAKTQAWRWNLDYVVDPHGNVMTYWYVKEANYYAKNGATGNGTAYTRGGYLSRIDYGQRKDTIFTAPASARVKFKTFERCNPVPGGETCKSLTTANRNAWPDVPFDQICKAATPCTDQPAPSFFSQQRLTDVTTQVYKGTGTGADTDYRDVNNWHLEQSFPDPGDGSNAGLWLKSIQHTGMVGTAVPMPAITFTGIQLDNRVDKIGDDVAPYIKWRVRTVTSETGSVLTVNYSNPECIADTNIPAKLDDNTKRCYPVKWIPPSNPTPGTDPKPRTDWFHKYVVTQVSESDPTGGAPLKQTDYTYSGGGAWSYDDQSPITPAKYRTWGIWRGYQKVTTTTGEAVGTRSKTTSLYYRGMDGDKQSDGTTRKETVTDSKGTAKTDSDQYAGQQREQITYNGTDGAEVSGTITTPWAQTTATDKHSYGTVHAYMVRTDTTVTRTAIAGGDELTSTSTNSYDTTSGLPLTAETNAAGEKDCTLTEYATNNSSWILSLPKKVEKLSVGCDVTPKRTADPKTTDVVSDVRTSYDGQAWGKAPTEGEATSVQRTIGYKTDGSAELQTVSTGTYDALGRLTDAWDVNGTRTRHVDYTPAAGGPLTKQVEKNALDHTMTTEIIPDWGVNASSTDPNLNRTDLAYDGLGRLTKVWLGDRSRAANQTPSQQFEYQVQKTAASWVATKTLNNDGTTYQTSYTMYDALLRPRQTQSPAAVGGGRVITEKKYDTRGIEFESSTGYIDTTAPSNKLATLITAAPAGAEVVYDGAGRPVIEKTLALGKEFSRTNYTYTGDTTLVEPPPGASAVQETADARGRTVQKIEYDGNKASTAFTKLTYGYDHTGQLARVTDSDNNNWTYGYDFLGRKTSNTDPDAGTSTTEYDKLNQVIASTDGRKTNTLGYTYDLIGRPTGKLDGKIPLVDGKPVIDDAKYLARWTYDSIAIGQPTSAIRYVGGKNGQVYASTNAAYDKLYRVLKEQYTVSKSEGALAGTGTWTISNSYNLDGTLQKRTIPAMGGLAQEVLEYGYTDQKMPDTLKGLTGIVQDTDYLPAGEQIRTTLGVSSTAKWTEINNSYEDGTKRLARQTVVSESHTGTDSDVYYRYDQAGNPLEVDERATSPGDKQCFTYDGHRRLKTAWTAKTDCATAPTTTTVGGSAPYWQSFTYDTAGNRKTAVNQLATGGPATTNYTYKTATQTRPHALASTTTSNAAGTLLDTTSYTYDNAGNTHTRTLNNQAQTLDWGLEGELSNVTAADKTTTSFLNDANGNRLIRRDATGTTLYLGETELRLDKASGTVQASRYYSHGGQTVAVRTAAKLTWIASDRNGTASAQIDATSQTLTRRQTTPFGEERGVLSNNWVGEKGFVGGTEDPTGLTHLGARDYDAANGRFVSVDPVMDPSDPQQINGYAYSNNNPVTFADPSGKFFDPLDLGIILATVFIITVALLSSGGGTSTTSGGMASTGSGNYTTSGSSGTGTDCSATYPAYKPGCNTNVEPEDPRAQGSFKDLAQGALNNVLGNAAGLADLAYMAAVPWCSLTSEGCTPNRDDFDRLVKEHGLKKDNKAYDAGDGAAEVGGFIAGLVGLARHLAEKLIKSGAQKGAKKAATECTKCFLAGTDVEMADGTTKNIEDIKVGDKVLATDPETGQTGARPVTRLIVTDSDKHFNELTIQTDEGAEKLTATFEHPFWVPSEGRWVQAGDLRPSMTLRTDDGTTVTVRGNRSYSQYARTFNFTVADLHTYYVLAGETPVLVHNSSCPTFTTGKPISGPLPDAGQTSLYALVKPSSGELLKWGISKNPIGRYKNSDYEGGARMVIVRNYDSRQDALDVERYMTERHPGPLNFEPHRGSVTPTQSWEKDLQHVTGGGFFRDRDGW